MTLLSDMDFLEYAHLHQLQNERGEYRQYTRGCDDHFDSLSDFQFKKNFRFSKAGVIQLTDILNDRLQ